MNAEEYVPAYEMPTGSAESWVSFERVCSTRMVVRSSVRRSYIPLSCFAICAEAQFWARYQLQEQMISGEPA